MNSGRTTVNLRGRLRALTGGVAVILALVTGVQGIAHAAVSPTPTKTMNFGGPAIYDLVVLDSGRVIVVGKFTSIGPNQRSNVGALLPTGKADTAFAPVTNGEVRAVAAHFAMGAGEARADGAFDRSRVDHLSVPELEAPAKQEQGDP